LILKIKILFELQMQWRSERHSWWQLSTVIRSSVVIPQRSMTVFQVGCRQRLH